MNTGATNVILPCFDVRVWAVLCGSINTTSKATFVAVSKTGLLAAMQEQYRPEEIESSTASLG